jgi:uncharacterized repeat protein (TIGR02543 family)
MIKRLYLLILVMLFAAPGLLAQKITLGDVVGDPGEILVPIYAEDFPPLSGITLTIRIDTDVVEFLELVNTDPSMGGMWVPGTRDGGREIRIAWFTGTTATVDGKIADLKLDYRGGFETELEFVVEDCEILRTAGLAVVEGVTYENGSVGPDGFVGSVFMDTVEGMIGEEVLVPITIGGAGFSEVSGISLVIEIDPDQLDFQEIVPAPGYTFTANESQNNISIAWTGEADFTEDTHILDIKLIYKGGGIAPLTFKGTSEVSANLGALPVEFISGMVVPADLDAKLIIPHITKWVEEIIVPDPDEEDLEQYEMMIDIPVLAENIDSSVASISLVIGFDADQITFEGYTAAQFPQASWEVNADGNQVIIAWANPAGATIADGEVIVLQFKYIGAVDTDITFKGGSNLTGPDLNFVPVSFVSGSFLVSDEKFDLVLLVEPEDAGTVTGAGTFLPGTEIEVDAEPAEGYLFVNWTDLDGNVVSEVTANTITMVPGGLTLIANFEEIPPPVYNVTFNVNMTYVDGYHHEFTFDPENDVVYVTGSIFGWAEPGSEPGMQTMVPSDDDPMIYTLTIELEAGEYAYKYFLNDGWDGGEWTGDPNRTFEVVDEDVVLNDWFGSLNDPTNVPEVDPITLQVYPNPARDVLNIVSSELIQEIRLINMLGQMIHTSTVESANVQLNVSGFDRGIYFIQIRTDKGFTTERVQITR